jgi:hypothetical protein
MELEQRIMIKFLTKKSFDAIQILAKLQTYFRQKPYALRTVRLWIAEIRREWEYLHVKHHTGRPSLDYIDTDILRIIGKSRFESTRSITQTFEISPSAVLHHFHQILGFKSFHLSWAPHLFNHCPRLSLLSTEGGSGFSPSRKVEKV